MVGARARSARLRVFFPRQSCGKNRLKSFFLGKQGGIRVHILWTVLIILVALFALVVLVYWFNLDTKLVKALEKPMMKHYDKLRRDHRL